MMLSFVWDRMNRIFFRIYRINISFIL